MKNLNKLYFLLIMLLSICYVGCSKVADILRNDDTHIVGSISPPSGIFYHDVYVLDNYAYVTDQGLTIIDVTNPRRPKNAGSIYFGPNGANRIFVSAKYAYVTDFEGLKIIDVEEPAYPKLVGSVKTNQGKGDVYISGNYAYVMEYRGGFQIIDISNPANPTIVNSIDTPGSMSSVFISGNYAYIADGRYGEGLLIFNISNPANPIKAYSYDIEDPRYVSIVTVSGNYAYFIEVVGDATYEKTETYALKIMDITDPINPKVLGSVPTAYGCSDIYISGNYAYVATEYGLQIFSITNKAEPKFIDTLKEGSTSRLCISSNYAYVTSSDVLQIFDISSY